MIHGACRSCAAGMGLMVVIGMFAGKAGTTDVERAPRFALTRALLAPGTLLLSSP